MYTLTQYVSAALHDGFIDPELIIKDYENKHQAKTVEIGIERETIYKEALTAKFRNTITNVFMLIVLSFALHSYQSYRESYDSPEPIDALIIPYFLIAFVLYIKQIFINSKLSSIAKDNIGNNSVENNQNVIISGGYSPFIGYGNDLNSWSFVVDLKKQSLNSSIKKITLPEFLNIVSNNIKSNFCDAVISDKLFVNGKDIRHNSLFMSSIMAEPNVSLSQDILAGYIEHADRIERSDKNIRHYRHIEIPIWYNNLTLSVFLKFSTQGHRLFVEARYFLLPPIKEELMILDNITARLGIAYYIRLIFITLFKSLFSWIGGVALLLSWIGFVQDVTNELLYGNPEENFKRKNETYNYGKQKSLRELLSESSYHRYFQALDKDKNYKITQHIILNSIIDYLDSKGISTEEIKQTQTTIINSGVMINGGTVNTEQMSVGFGAKVTNTINKLKPN